MRVDAVSSRTAAVARRKQATAQCKICRPVGSTQRQSFPERRLVNLDDGDAGRLQISHLIADRQRDLPADFPRGRSSRTKDHCSMVTGPVSMPFIGCAVTRLRMADQRTVIGAGRDTSPQMIGGATQRLPYDCTQPCRVKA